MTDKRREGGVVIPVVEVADSILYFMMIPPREEDLGKKIETVVGSEWGLRPVTGYGLPGGAAEEKQSVLCAAIEEFGQETSGNGLDGVVIDSIKTRLTPAFEAVAAYQERPKPTNFDVTMYLLQLNSHEKDEMILRGCELAMLDLATGHIYKAEDGSDVAFRPIHEDLLGYLAMISSGFSNMIEEVSYAEAVVN